MPRFLGRAEREQSGPRRCRGAALERGAGTEEEPFTFGNVRVVPNPARMFRSGRADVRLLSGLWIGSFRGPELPARGVHVLARRSGALEADRSEPIPTDKTERAVFSSFDTARFPPGGCRLSVKVDDLVRGQSSSKELILSHPIAPRFCRPYQAREELSALHRERLSGIPRHRTFTRLLLEVNKSRTAYAPHCEPGADRRSESRKRRCVWQ